MSDSDNTQDDAAMSPASAGSVVAWAIVCGDCVDSTFCDRDEAVQWACGLIPPPQIVPLYRSPTLTDAERTLLNRLACEADHPRAWTNRALTPDDRATLRGLLERTQ